MPTRITKNPSPQVERRILLASAWGQDWTVAKMIGSGDTADQKKFGFDVISVVRKAFPDIGVAKIRFDYGKINYRLHQVDDGTDGVDVWAPPSEAGDDTIANRLRYLVGGSFQVLSDLIFKFANTKEEGRFVVPDLRGYEIRIQEKVDAGQTNFLDDPILEWRDVFWGQAMNPRDTAMPGSEIAQGVMEWDVLDGTARLAEWPLAGHRFSPDGGSSVFPHDTGDTATATGTCRGNPGYNVKADLMGRVLGNRCGSSGDSSSDSSGYYVHTWPGTEHATTFTDAEVVSTAIQSSKPDTGTHPDFALAGVESIVGGANVSTLAMLGRANVWPVSEGMRVRDLLKRIFNRRRGVVAMLDWPDTSAGSDLTAAAFVPVIRIVPTTYENIEATLPSGATWKMAGARAVVAGEATRTIDLDVTGDHRLGDDAESSFSFAQNAIASYDKVTSRANQIITVLTVSQGADITARANAAENTEYDNNGTTTARPLRDGYARRDYGFPLDWNYTIGGDRIDYRITFDPSDNSNTLEAGSGTTRDTSPMFIRLLDHVPLYEGYDYTSLPPALYEDGNSPPNFYRAPSSVMVWDGDADATVTKQVRITRGGNGGNDIKIIAPDRGNVDSWGLDFTIAITTGYRLEWSTARIEDGAIISSSDIKRVKFVEEPGLCLHVAHEDAKFSGTAPKTFSGLGVGGEPPILRDDRDELVRRHLYAVEYYLTDRRPFRCSIDAGGGHHETIRSEVVAYTDTTGAQVQGNTAYKWPKLGDFIHRLTYSGRTVITNSVVTSYAFNYHTGQVSFETDHGSREAL